MLATEWGIEEQSLYGIEGWSLFRGCFITRVYVAAIRTWASGRYKATGCSSGAVVKRGSTVYYIYMWLQLFCCNHQPGFDMGTMYMYVHEACDLCVHVHAYVCARHVCEYYSTMQTRYDVEVLLYIRGVAQLFLSCPETPLAWRKHGWGYY